MLTKKVHLQNLIISFFIIKVIFFYRHLQQMRPTKLEVKGNRIRQLSTPAGSSGSGVIGRRPGLSSNFFYILGIFKSFYLITNIHL